MSVYSYPLIYMISTWSSNIRPTSMIPCKFKWGRKIIWHESVKFLNFLLEMWKLKNTSSFRIIPFLWPVFMLVPSTSIRKICVVLFWPEKPELSFEQLCQHPLHCRLQEIQSFRLSLPQTRTSFFYFTCSDNDFKRFINASLFFSLAFVLTFFLGRLNVY